MRKRLWSLTLSLGLGLGIAGQFANADPILPFNYSENFNLFGDQVNNICGRGVCAAIAAINSFVFLEKKYPKVYDNKLLPNYNAKTNTDPMDAANFAVNGWKVDNNPMRQGYYTRGDSKKNQDPIWNSAFLATKQDWFGDYVPKTTYFSSMWFNGGGGYPTLAFLSTEIKNQEDVEFFVKDKTTSGNGVYHGLTLTGISCTGNNYTNCSITYQDPNAPTVNQSTMLGMMGPGGSLSFTSLPGTGIKNTTLYIDAAFAESPIPEPALPILVGAVVTGLIVAKRRGKRI